MGKECCCSADNEPKKSNQNVHRQHAHEHHEHEHTHEAGDENVWWKQHGALIAALIILITEITLQYSVGFTVGQPLSFFINGLAYLLAGWNVLILAFRKIKRGDIFNEFVLMSVATLGAFCIGEYSEGVAVMVFYSIGEWFQDEAVSKAKRSIKALLDIRPDKVTVIRNGSPEIVNPSSVQIGETIRIKPGEKVALDGELLSDAASFNTSALTGESKPNTIYQAGQVLAGMINLNTVADVKISALFKDSKLSRILELVQDATARKSQTQLFISRFAKVYTPIVFFLALTVVLIPYLIVDNYLFDEWLYRGLVFLVISCPCALVVSIPLGYFGGIGLASKNGILFKGGNFIDAITQVNTVVLDKTGTLTKGVFKVQEIVSAQIDKKDLIRLTAALESNSEHPVAKAIVDYAGEFHLQKTPVSLAEEIAGHGLKGKVDGKEILAGNLKLLKKFNILYPDALEDLVHTLVAIAIDGQYAGYITIADELKDDSKDAIVMLHKQRIRTIMLSGDKQQVVDDVAYQLGIEKAYGDLLPEGKVKIVQALRDEGLKVLFVGDGVNDAPVIALSDVGIAMGGLGSDAAIETADVVIQDDRPSRISSAIKVGKLTRSIVWQNIFLAIFVKMLVLALGAGGLANLWEAVIADVGVALMAILNAVRIQNAKL